jgi:predicted nucleic acid-binding protein
VKGIADTGFLVAFLNRSDKHHSWALQIAGTIDAPLVTCEAVLTEAAHLVNRVKSSAVVLDLVETGLIEVRFDFHAALPRLQKQAARYADRSPDLADLCLICLSEDHPQREVVTVDWKDFQIYRRWDQEPIPTRTPIGA